MAKITVRRLDANYDPIQGNGLNNFLTDIDAVAQIIMTRLKLFYGEWWEDVTDGTMIFQTMLGVGGSGKHPEAAVHMLKQRILDTPFVLEVYNVVTNYDPKKRYFRFQCWVRTQFGSILITNANAQPANSAKLQGS